MNIIKKIPRISSEEVKQQLPLSLETQKDIAQHRQDIADIIQGRSAKKLIIIGPCSADFEKSVLTIAERLQELQIQVADQLLLVLRLGTGKPRNNPGARKGIERTGQPGSNATPDGALCFTRKLLLDIVSRGVPIANELLYPENIPFFDDLLSHGWLGSKSSLNQAHVELASGMTFPIGIKNPFAEDIHHSVNSIALVNNPQEVVYDGHHCRTEGNPDTHIILRGTNINGVSKKNCDLQSVEQRQTALKIKGLNHRIVIDLNHDNSAKDGLQQPANLRDVFAQNNDAIIGVMVESHLRDGKESSLTDSCLGLEKSEQMIIDLHKQLMLKEIIQ